MTLARTNPTREALSQGGEHAVAAFHAMMPAIYERLRSVMLADADAMAPAVKRQWSRLGLRSESDVMEFIATYLDELARSADRGSLLAGFAWDDADADPVRYLTGSVIRLRVVDFVARNTWHASLEEYDTVQTSADRRDAPDAWTAREARVRALTVRLRWSEGDAMTALLTVAAVQTWPSHDQNWTERKAARSAAVTSAATGESTIEAAVESGRAAIAVRLRAIALELKDHPNMAGATVRRKEARASKLLVQLLIAPIAAAELAEVLSLSSKAAAEQRLSRYRNARGSLLQIWSDGQEVRVV